MVDTQYTDEQKAKAVTLEALASDGPEDTKGGLRLVVYGEGTPHPCYFHVSLVGIDDFGVKVYRCSDFKSVYDLKLMKVDDNSKQQFDELSQEMQKNGNLFGHHDNLGRLREAKFYDPQQRIYGVKMDHLGLSLRKLMGLCCPNGMAEKTIAVVLEASLKALSFLHGKHQVHKQVNAGHIFADGNKDIKLAFGACIYEDGGGHDKTNTCFLPESTICDWAAAPEVFHSQNYSPKSDIWMIGITALELRDGGLKVASREGLEVRIAGLIAKKGLQKESVKFGKIKDMVKIGKGTDSNNPRKRTFSNAFEEMVITCLACDPTERPTADELLQNRFFKKAKGVSWTWKNM